MDNENVVVKVEPEEYVVVKEETVDLTEDSGYESLISLDSDQLDDIAKCPKSDGIDTNNVKSSVIISEGINSKVYADRPPNIEYDFNMKKDITNSLIQFPYPLVPPFTLPFVAQPIPLGLYPPSPYLPNPYYQFPMTPFPMLGHVQHPNNWLSSTSFPHINIHGKPTKDTDEHQGTPDNILKTPSVPQDLKSTPNQDERPLHLGKVKKRPKVSSIPYERNESKSTENKACLNITEQPIVNTKQFSDTGLIKPVEKDDPARPFKCTVCNRGFAKKYYLSVHMRLHTGQKSYRCSQCPKTFRQRNSLVVHQQLHNDNRPFECSLCDMRFANKSNIKRHFVSHIPEKTGEINYNELRRSL